MELIKKPDKFPMSIESDEDLLVLMSFKDDKESCNAAFNEFHKRYKDFLYHVLQEVCSDHPNKNELIKVIFNNVFINVYTYCDSFSVESERDEKKIQKKIMGWLVSIARTEYRGIFTKSERKDESLIYRSMVKSAQEKPKYSYNSDIVAKAFLQIPKDRDRDILRTYWIYFEKGEKSQAKNLPDHVLNDLSSRYNTTKENIRTIISRGNKIVKAYLECNYNLKK